MSMIMYLLFSVFLYFWTTMSIHYESSIPNMEYMFGVVVLAVFILIFGFVDRKKLFQKGIMIAAVFMNLGLSMAYRIWPEEDSMSTLWLDFHERYVNDLIQMLLIFIVIYLVIRYTRIYKFKLCNYLFIAALPIFIYGARLSGDKTGGSYLYFGSMMIFGLVLMGFPFVAAHFVSAKENKYTGSRPNVRHLPWNLMCLLLYTFLLYGGCVVCNEFGLLLILGLSTTVIFMIRCKNGITKLIYSVVCAGGAFLAGYKISHLSDRIQIWLNPAQAYSKDDLAGKAESTVYLFRHFYSMGWWGKGIGSLSQKLYPTLNTDHALITLLNDYSALIVIAVLILSILFVRWMLSQSAGLEVYDQYLNLTCGLIVAFIILVDVSSNIGSFLTSGIGFPWISEGGSVNIMLMTLLAIHCGLLGKKVNLDA